MTLQAPFACEVRYDRKEAMDPQARAKRIDEISQLIEEAKQRHAALGARNLKIYRGEKEPKFLLTAEGNLVYARSNRRVNLDRLTPRNLNAIKQQLRAHLMHISQ